MDKPYLEKSIYDQLVEEWWYNFVMPAHALITLHNELKRLRGDDE